MNIVMAFNEGSIVVKPVNCDNRCYPLSRLVNED